MINFLKSRGILFLGILLSVLVIAGAFIYSPEVQEFTMNAKDAVVMEDIVLPVSWRELSEYLVGSGAVDKEKFQALYLGQDTNSLDLFLSADEREVVMTEENSGLLLNLFWALGLASKNPVLASGPIASPQYGGAEVFASTGGWTLAKGSPMDHFNRHSFISLTQEQQGILEKMSKNIYRPCCNNPTYFPDCNHGMAMLGLLELLLSEGQSEQEAYQVALQANIYWFPETYQNLAQYFIDQNINPKSVDSEIVLSFQYSSGSGYQKIKSLIKSNNLPSKGSCSV